MRRELENSRNMSAIALQNLLAYLTGTLTISNRQWLAAHLIESNKNEMAEKQRLKEEKYVRDSLNRAMTEVKQAMKTGKQLQTADDFLLELQKEGL